VVEAIHQKAHELQIDLIAIDSELPALPSRDEETALYEELIAQDLDVVIGSGFPADLTRRVLATGVPIVDLNETETRHPLSVFPKGLYEIARLISAFLAEKLCGRGTILAVGGLLAPDRAVHLDPALWHPDDSEENVAVQLINTICSVPMVSIELDRYPQRHLDLIGYWIGFYQAHRDTIVHGRFMPEIRLGHVPLIRFTSEIERIIGVYDDVAFAPGAGALPLWVLNGSTQPFVEFCADELIGPHIVRVRDKFGRLVGEQTVALPVARLAVEVGGSLEIRSQAA
jgi:hypothetical protein